MTNCCRNPEGIIKDKPFSPLQTGTEISFSDLLGQWKARWNIGRMNYRVEPGLYYTGEPGPGSEIFVSANYKMSFDILRKNLKGINAWIIVLETRGINVWCAAGKGTFGTDELVRMISQTGIRDIVDHNRIILPQLGAPGISAHEVMKRSGMKVFYGPVRASDIGAFLKNNLEASREMRKISFGFKERMVLSPVEFITSLKFLPLIAGLLYLFISLIGGNPVSLFLPELGIYTGSLFTGTLLFPALLPILPSRYFFIKGWFLGLVYVLSANLIFYGTITGTTFSLFLIPPIVSFLSYNFTGSTTFTSLSGVEKELRIALPWAAVSLAAGLIISILEIIQ